MDASFTIIFSTSVIVEFTVNISTIVCLLEVCGCFYNIKSWILLDNYEYYYKHGFFKPLA